MNNKTINTQSKILIVGTSGSGKSTLAKNLSHKFNLRDIELDALFWGPNWTPSEATDFRNKITDAINIDDGWVIHGNYSKVQDITWPKASTLIWLNYSRPIVFWRVLKRSILRILKKEELWAGNKETFKKTFLSKDSIILWSINTFPLRQKQYREVISSGHYPHLDILEFKTPSETEHFLSSLKLPPLIADKVIKDPQA